MIFMEMQLQSFCLKRTITHLSIHTSNHTWTPHDLFVSGVPAHSSVPGEQNVMTFPKLTPPRMD